MKKRVVFIIIIVIVLLVTFANLNWIKLCYYQLTYSNRLADFTFGELCVFRANGTQTVLVNRNGEIEMAVVYTSNREILNSTKLTPCSIDNIQQYVGQSFEDVQMELGLYHVNSGEGFFTPSYLTIDGYVVCFGVEGDTVWMVQKYDLYSGESVELFVDKITQEK